MTYDFFAMMSRMKYIERWALMRNSTSENISEHSLEVAMIAHALAVIGKVRFGKDVNPEKAALLGIYHDCTEIITGDMPTPVKYYNKEIKNAYKEIEREAAKHLLSMLPEDMRTYYEEVLLPSGHGEMEELCRYAKAADKLSALIKCIEEEKAGNREFVKAMETVKTSVETYDLPEMQVFLEEFLPGYYKTLDEISEAF